MTEKQLFIDNFAKEEFEILIVDNYGCGKRRKYSERWALYWARRLSRKKDIATVHVFKNNKKICYFEKGKKYV